MAEEKPTYIRSKFSKKLHTRFRQLCLEHDIGMEELIRRLAIEWVEEKDPKWIEENQNYVKEIFPEGYEVP